MAGGIQLGRWEFIETEGYGKRRLSGGNYRSEVRNSDNREVGRGSGRRGTVVW